MATNSIDEKGVLLSCPSCGQRNRLAWDRLAGQGRCASCKQALGTPPLPLAVTSQSQFSSMIAASALPVLVDFWAAWCGPCRSLAPELEKLAISGSGEFLIAKVDTEALPDLARQFAIRSIPSLLLFAHGSEVSRTAGAQSAGALQNFIHKALAG
ncbi:MAG: thioredoxin [Gammaproteobacteria bacterium]|nr:thioredoxin [Gammaproteobacteria bacterium]